MTNSIQDLIQTMKEDWCSYCDFKYPNCRKTTECNRGNYIDALQNILREKETPAENQPGCHICTGKNGVVHEIFYDLASGGLGIAKFCPNCGKKII